MKKGKVEKRNLRIFLSAVLNLPNIKLLNKNNSKDKYGTISNDGELQFSLSQLSNILKDFSVLVYSRKANPNAKSKEKKKATNLTQHTFRPQFFTKKFKSNTGGIAQTNETNISNNIEDERNKAFKNLAQSKIRTDMYICIYKLI